MLLNIMPVEWSDEHALHSAAQATGNGNILDLKGMHGTLILQVTGTFSGTIVPKVSNDDVNYVERLAIDGKTGIPSYSITAPGIYTIDVIGIKKFKAEITAYTSGSITVTALGLPIAAGMDNAAAKLISTLNEKIDKIVDGSAPATTTLTGSSGQQVSVTNNKLDVNATVNATVSGTGEEIISAPVVGVKTVVATAAELFAGASAKVGRRKLVIKNEDQCLRLRVGPSTLTQQNGYPIEPGAIAEFKFDPNTAVPIYAISEGAAISVAVWEV